MDRHQTQSGWAVDVSLEIRFSCLSCKPDSCVAGANLMGSDLYNNLIRYFVTHLKGLREVGCFMYQFHSLPEAEE